MRELRRCSALDRVALHQDAGISSAYNDLAVLNRIYLRHVDVYRYGIDSARLRTRDPPDAASGGWRLCQGTASWDPGAGAFLGAAGLTEDRVALRLYAWGSSSEWNVEQPI